MRRVSVELSVSPTPTPTPTGAGHDLGAASVTAWMESFYAVEWHCFQKVVLFSACLPPLRRDSFVVPGIESLLCFLLETGCSGRQTDRQTWVLASGDCVGWGQGEASSGAPLGARGQTSVRRRGRDLWALGACGAFTGRRGERKWGVCYCTARGVKLRGCGQQCSPASHACESGVGSSSLADASTWCSLRCLITFSWETVGSWVPGHSSLACLEPRWGVGTASLLQAASRSSTCPLLSFPRRSPRGGLTRLLGLQH